MRRLGEREERRNKNTLEGKDRTLVLFYWCCTAADRGLNATAVKVRRVRSVAANKCGELNKCETEYQVLTITHSTHLRPYAINETEQTSPAFYAACKAEHQRLPLTVEPTVDLLVTFL